MKILLTGLLTLSLSGCGSLLKTEYQRPELLLPAEWQNKNTGQSWLKQTPQWWNIFNDPQLTQAINDVLASNNDLAAAGIRLQQARLDAGLTATNLTPDVSLSGDISNNKNTRRNTESHENFGSSFSLSYEIDLWGKLARTREKAQWLAEASALDRQNTALVLIGTTGQLYWQIASLNQKISYGEHGLEIAQETEWLTRSGFRAGAIGQRDVLQAGQSVLEQQSSLRTLRQQREEARNSLALLFNRPPSMRVSERGSLDLYQNIILTPDTPLSVIGRRPDVQSAEWQLRAALAGTDAAALSFYPTLSLNATLGASSTAFSQWFSNPVRTLGSSVALPFIQWNTVQLTIERSELDVQQAAITFRSKVYNALADVEKALSQRNTYAAQRQEIFTSLSLGQQRLALVESQYLAGAVSLQTFLDAQNSVLSTENQLVDIQYSYLNSTLQLWMAMGGEAIPENRVDRADRPITTGRTIDEGI
jgi:NodT family efflux transporter outer membrane factor (OMF) lipoprotein